jgi:hypothetical protein
LNYTFSTTSKNEYSNYKRQWFRRAAMAQKLCK